MKQDKNKLFRIIILFSGVGLVALFLSLGTPTEGGCGGEQQIEVQTGVAESQEKKGLKRGPSAEAPSAAGTQEYVGEGDSLPPGEESSVGSGPVMVRDTDECEDTGHSIGGLRNCVSKEKNGKKLCPVKPYEGGFATYCELVDKRDKKTNDWNDPTAYCKCCTFDEDNAPDTCVPCNDCATEL